MDHIQLKKTNERITIDDHGTVLVNMCRHIPMNIEEETGYRIFTVKNNLNPKQEDTRYVHVEVFSHHGSLPGNFDLGPEDVTFLDDSRPDLYNVTNLVLSDSGKAKVYGGESAPPPEEAPILPNSPPDEPIDDEEKVSDSEPMPAETVETNKDSADSEPEESTQKIYLARVKSAGRYEIIDPATGDNVLADFGEASETLHGKTKVLSFAEKNGIKVNFG